MYSQMNNKDDLVLGGTVIDNIVPATKRQPAQRHVDDGRAELTGLAGGYSTTTRG